MVDELTQALVLRLTTNQSAAAPAEVAVGAPSRRRSLSTAQTLLAQGDERMAQGAYAEAVNFYQELLALDSRHAVAHNNLGAALCKLGHYQEARARSVARSVAVRAMRMRIAISEQCSDGEAACPSRSSRCDVL